MFIGEENFVSFYMRLNVVCGEGKLFRSFHYPKNAEVHMRKVEFQVVPAGHRQVPPVQTPDEQVLLVQYNLAPAALRHVLVFS